MQIMKLSTIFLLGALFIATFIPEAQAGCCRRKSTFGVSFNVGSPGYVVAPAPAVVAPAPVYPGYVAPAPYPYYNYYAAPAPVYVQEPYYVAPQAGVTYTYKWKNRWR